MHFEVLVEDASGRVLLDYVLPKILGQDHSWETHAYKGIGRIPPNLKSSTEARKRILLDRLPQVLAGYGRSLDSALAAVVVVVDLDDKNCAAFKQELTNVLDNCSKPPKALFRIAIEEMEAWLLGDPAAIRAAYPKAKISSLDSYRQDSICGTWQRLADAVYPGGSKALRARGYPLIGQAKHEWASRIGPHVEPGRNQSPSFQTFRTGLLKLCR